VTWTTEDRRPSAPVLGDPGSVSALAAALQRAAAEVDERLTALEPGDVDNRRHASRLRRLRSEGAATTASMGRAGRRLGDHAVELAEALALAQRVVTRAEGTGLEVDGPLVRRHPGVRGVADQGGERERGEALVRLQSVLDAVLRDLARARESLRSDLERERRRCTSR
jgi:hypothetical protein